MKYAIRSSDGCFLNSDNHRFSNGEIGPWALFYTNKGALLALQKRSWHYGTFSGELNLVGVEEDIVDMKREIVELEGTVDHAGLKYALRLPGNSYVTRESDGQLYDGALEDAVLWDSIGALVDAVGLDVYDTSGFWQGTQVVGVQEIRGETVYRIVEL